jgi:uncharacterized membrane protein YdjX (TVP38/TMEM64 family)
MQLYKEKREIIIVLFILAALIGIVYFIESSYTVADLKNYILSFGPWVPLVLLIIIIITSSIGFVSAVPVAIAALVLNVYLSFVISILGLTMGAAISFFIARYVGRDYVERRFIKRIKSLKRYDERLEKSGFLTILFLRMIYLIPYELINIAGGLSRIHFGKFILGTLLGIIPTIVITIYFVRSTNNYWSMQFVLALLIMTLFAVLPLLSRRIRQTVFNLK